MDLTKEDLKLKVEANLIHKNLYPLQWVTYKSKENENNEISNLIEVIDIIKNEEEKKSIITDYQFISVILDINDNSAARIWWRHHIYPSGPGKLYFEEWKNFLLRKIDKNEIKTIYTVHPLEGEENIFQDLINSECYSTAKMSKILTKKKIGNCSELVLNR